MDPQFEVIIASDPEHEKVFAEIQLGGKYIASVSQEDGPNRLVVELPGPGLDERYVLRQIPYKDFVFWLEEAAKKLCG